MPFAVAAAGITAGAGIYESQQGAGASQQAAKEQSKAIGWSNDFLTAQNKVDQAYLAPYAQTGAAANNQLALMMSNPSQFQAGFTASPGYQYNLNQQQGAIQNSAAAKGGLVGGNTLQALQTNASGLASQDYQQYITNLMSEQSVGQNASSSQAALGANYGNSFAGNITGQGVAQSAGTIGASNNTIAGINSAGTALGSVTPAEWSTFGKAMGSLF